MSVPYDQVELLLVLYRAMNEVPPDRDQIFRAVDGERGYYLQHPGLMLPYSPNWFSFRRLIRSGYIEQSVDSYESGFVLTEKGEEAAEAELERRITQNQTEDHLSGASEETAKPLTDPLSQTSVSAFVAYARPDADYVNSFRRHATTLTRSGKLTVWFDGELIAGKDWDDAIREKLRTSDYFLPMISADFLASDYGWDQELKTAMEARLAGQIEVVPIIVRPCDWKNSGIEHIQALPKDGKPIATWTLEDDAWLDVITQLRTAIDHQTVSEDLGRDDQGEEENEIIPFDPNHFAPLDAQVRLEELVEDIQNNMDAVSRAVESLTVDLESTAEQLQIPNQSAKRKNVIVQRLASSFRNTSEKIQESSPLISGGFEDFAVTTRLIIEKETFDTEEKKSEGRSLILSMESFLSDFEVFGIQVQGARAALVSNFPDVSIALSRARNDLDAAMGEFAGSTNKGVQIIRNLIPDLRKAIGEV